MRVISGRNVNDIYPVARGLLDEVGVRSLSRAGEVLVAPFPVCTVYERPTERVLFDSHRDANPFFHLMESLWMLSGSDDGRWLDRYVSDFSSRYAEEDGSVWGAYGHRWRRHFGKFIESDTGIGVLSDWEPLDQLTKVIELLRKDPMDRRAVIQMWDAETDLGAAKRDVPCNTQCYPRIVETRETRGGELCVDRVLDLTILCRSNDVIWGAYGANCVHFSVLQEYLAAAIGVGVGKLYQFSNNWHGYVDVLQKKPVRRESDPYFLGEVATWPMFARPDRADADILRFVTDPLGDYNLDTWGNPWFANTAFPMAAAHDCWKHGEKDAALAWAERVDATDWRRAAIEWLQRRKK